MSQFVYDHDLGKIEAEQIEKLRKQLGLTHEHFAQLLQTSLKTAIRWQRGLSSPKGASLMYLEDLFTLLSNGPESEKALQSLLANRDKIASSDLLRAIHAAAIICKSETRVFEIVQQLVGNKM